MDNQAEVRDSLMSRRAKITPAMAGIPVMGKRRVPGLRRSEVASLAGVSVEYYTKLERGAISGASASVLEALSRALQLNEIERAYLHDLARTADGIPTSGRNRRLHRANSSQRNSLIWLLDSIQDAVAFVRNDVQDLVGELSTQCEVFRRLWATHDVRTHGTGIKHFSHPEVGELELFYEELALTAEPGLTLYIYTAEPGSVSAEKLKLLGALAQTRSAQTVLLQ